MSDIRYDMLYKIYESMEQQKIPFDQPQKSQGVKKPDVVIIMFDDMNMNRTSPFKFSTDMKNWRKLQQKLNLGDYGGVMEAKDIISSLDNLTSNIESKALSGTSDINGLYTQETGVADAMIILQNLRKIAEAAVKANTKVAVISARVI